ncbi:xanthine dehydrogenase small subunit [Ottowia sp.]|uniref:xanthine dehydrogenase small subunit n=1 Tax=Ottowia sp. TaxID=1898956 RepID=UPI002B585CD6|nr:xanthine dehydrogenase small subunit [Ottowia sp.]HOB65207.1 xanthine dehydrogenase small subunit [Ottowia sp.]HPZ58205.1 xanthine dehydrogenase small subunit [Ottowia sp.]HQD49119.1 xanthine dehydrogenase small subunit [Ottowia sp.]
MSPGALRFVHRDAVVALDNVPPDRTLLDLLREDLHCTAVKEGCASGDCGACTVTLAEPSADGRLRYRAINSCIRLAHGVHGMAVFTAQDIAAADGTLHPAQRAMLACHGSQCGFCTPGFVMSLFALRQNQRGQPVSRPQALHALSGNLCRCTGYRPILDAAQTMHHWPDVPIDEASLLQKLQHITQDGQEVAADSVPNFPAPAYARPATLAQLLALRAAQPHALLAAGTTDVGLWVTKQHRRFGQIIDVTRVAELRRVERGTQSLSIGAAVPLTESFDALAAERPQLQPFFDRFAGLPVRESGTLGGNVANGSPIGDSMPLLIALGASLVLASTRGERTLPIEDFYLAYRKTALAPGEVLARIDVPLPTADEWLRADKISKRFEDDISAVCLAVGLQVEDGVIRSARIGAGGVAAVPSRATKTEAALAGQPCAEATFDAAARVLEAEFEPLSDMRASAAYRRAVLGKLLRRGWQQSQPGAVALADLTVEPLT